MSHDYKSITEFYLKFNEHPNISNILNKIYADSIPNHARLYTDPEGESNVLTDGDLVDTLRDIIIDEMIFPFAHHTDDRLSVATMINSATLTVESLDGTSTRRLTRTNLTALLDAARKQGRTTIIIGVGCGHMYANPALYINYFDWARLSVAPAPVSALTASTPPEIASAVASAFPVVDIVTPVATAAAATLTLEVHLALKSTPTGVSGTTGTSSSGTGSGTSATLAVKDIVTPVATAVAATPTLEVHLALKCTQQGNLFFGNATTPSYPSG